jgi:eukaryotic-like serine/threonine-protein kinase
VPLDIVGNYRLLRPMHTGQDSQVYEVVEHTSGRHFAMKLLLPEKTGDADLRKVLLHEAEVGRLLVHPNVVRIVEVGKDPRNPYFVMEFFPAGSLKLRILAAPKDPKQRDFLREQAQNILKQAATAYAFINAKGWVHRDVKPDNILVNSAAEVRIIDFAITQKVSTGMGGLFRKREKVAAGTRSYMSPEQIRCEALDGRSDVYSFGCTCYELIAGRPPFRAASSEELLQKHLKEQPIPPKEYNPEVTKDFVELILQMMAKKRDERPRNFHEVLIRMKGMRVFIPPPRGKPKPPAEGQG